MSLIYSPEEDSHLFSKVIKEEIKNKDISCLEVGVGSGVQLKILKELGVKEIKGVDINRAAINHCKKLGFDCFFSDLFSKVEGNFDLIIFNPPYLPKVKGEGDESRLATTGGKKGSEVINRFLKEAKEHLEKKGKIFMLTSTFTKDIDWSDWKKKLLANKKLFFEELFVWEITF